MIGKILILIYFGFQIADVISRNQTSLTFYNYKRNLSIDSTPIVVDRNNFDFALYLYYDTTWNPTANKSVDI